MVAMATNSNITVPQKYTAKYKNVGYGWDTSHPTTISKKFIILIYHYLHAVHPEVLSCSQSYPTGVAVRRGGGVSPPFPCGPGLSPGSSSGGSSPPLGPLPGSPPGSPPPGSPLPGPPPPAPLPGPPPPGLSSAGLLPLGLLPPGRPGPLLPPPSLPPGVESPGGPPGDLPGGTEAGDCDGRGARPYIG